MSSPSSRSGISLRKVSATEHRASSGHSLNQSMVQQLTNEGNCLRRALKISPMGLKGGNTTSVQVSVEVMSDHSVSHKVLKGQYRHDRSRLSTGHGISVLV